MEGEVTYLLSCTIYLCSVAIGQLRPCKEASFLANNELLIYSNKEISETFTLQQ
ncbi:hypothetical protein BJP35_2282 [Enterobacter sp. J49]|nr:hypothetical protein BJP35_2282 [Enterobacter sp. J49]